MSTLDDIAKERQLLAERLARIDGERAKMAEQLAELEAAERVLSRFTKFPVAGLDPAIHVFSLDVRRRKTSVTGSNPATEFSC